MKFIKIAIFVNMLQVSLSLCGQGCLSCTQDNTCLLCDKQNGFFKSEGGGCELTLKQNCQIFDFKENCLQCSQNYYYNTSLGHCLEVPSDFLDVNCS